MSDNTHRPTLGRIVHYTKRTGIVCPAIVVAVRENDEVSLHVMSEDGFELQLGVPKTDATPGTPESWECWNWPPRV